MPEYEGKTHYLMMINTKDCVKDRVTGCYLTRSSQTTNTTEPKPKKEKKKQDKDSEKSTKTKGSNLTKLERKAKYNEHKRRLQEIWTTEMESEEETRDTMSVPSHFKRYTLQDRKIVLQQPL